MHIGMHVMCLCTHVCVLFNDFFEIQNASYWPRYTCHIVTLEYTRIFISKPCYCLDPYLEINDLCIFALTCKAVLYDMEF